MSHKPPSFAEIRTHVLYNATEGTFRKVSGHVASSKTISPSPSGARKCPTFQVPVGKRKVSAHILAWIYSYGVPPSRQIKHLDGDRMNNALANLAYVENPGEPPTPLPPLVEWNMPDPEPAAPPLPQPPQKPDRVALALLAARRVVRELEQLIAEA